MSTNDANDDQQWLDLLAGRSVPEADARTRKEAAWLRAALLSYRVTAPPGAPAAADDRVGRLLARAREAGVLAAAAQEPPASRKAANQWRYALAASVVAFGAVLILLPARQGIDEAGPADGIWRGATVQRIEARDATLRRQQLLHELRGAGFDAQPFERLGRIGIDLALPVPLPATQAATLTRLGLEPPEGPSLQIEITTPPPARQ
ncbi:hypothetical protein OOZ63_24100 [Paucibacter sp. PLA-PC-4]|uniref:hypothetical protein n=1 Tax=Paucibacter sp. PLA-PC-4 TaxID=2993655 RepID=UPI00224AA2DB|nr:hypothetical protein [Paucibacter sp. PLA-PC-4]MCX2864918.1 hypothetical protein [Paucibacter sp. PLA-PC-4]